MYMKCTEHYTSLYGCFFIVFVFVSYGSSHILSLFVFFISTPSPVEIWNASYVVCVERRQQNSTTNKKNRQWKERATDKTNKSFKRKKMNKWRNRMKTERWRNNNWLCQHKGKMLVDDKKKHFFSCCCPRTMRKLWIDKFLSFFFRYHVYISNFSICYRHQQQRQIKIVCDTVHISYSIVESHRYHTIHWRHFTMTLVTVNMCLLSTTTIPFLFNAVGLGLRAISTQLSFCVG